MAFSLFGKKKDKPSQNNADDAGETTDERGVRPMTRDDIDAVVAIIEAHDEDDAEEAAEGFANSLSGMFVAVDKSRVVGVTGAIEDPEANGVCWLSWTYVDESQRRQGMGRYLVDGLLHELKASGIRKLFMSTGDYVEDGEDIYAPAKAFYLSLGAALELKIDDYFDVGEARYVYGLDIVEPPEQAPPEQAGHLIFDDLHPIDECESGVMLTWREYNPGKDDDDPAAMLQSLIGGAQKQKYQFVLAAVPEDLALGATKGLEQSDFSALGKLKNYYQPGICQEFWILRF